MPRNVSAFVLSAFRYPPEVRTNERKNERVYSWFAPRLINERARDCSHVRSKQIFESATWRTCASLALTKAVLGKRLEYTCGWFRARRERTWFISYGHRAHTLVWRTECPCLLKIALTTPAIHLHSIRSHFLPSGQRNQAEFCIYD